MLTENKTTEFKRDYVDDIKNTIIAFANCDGGTLFIGLNDDGSVYGVDDVDETMLRVTNAVCEYALILLCLWSVTMKLWMEKMIKETSGDSYETARSINQQLTFEKASNFFKKRNV